MGQGSILTVFGSAGFAALAAYGAAAQPAQNSQVAAAEYHTTTLVESDFTGTAPAQNVPWQKTSALAPDISFGGWDLGANAFAAALDDAFGFYVNAPGNALSSLAEALAQDEFVSCMVGPKGTGSLDLARVQISFSIQRLSWHAPLAYAVFSSVEGFALGDELFTTTPTTKDDYSVHDWSFFLPSAGYAALTGPIELRIYAYQAEWGGHDTSLTAFRLVDGVPALKLTLAPGPGGVIVASPATTWFSPGDVVVLSALPDPGFRFAEWSGAVVGPGSPRTLVMQIDERVMASFDPLPQTHMQVGMNLSGVEDWNTSWPFVDVFKRTRTWMTRNQDGSGPWGSGLQSLIPTDPSGWPTQVPFDPGGGSPLQIVHTILSNVDEAGTYTVLFEGSGTLKIGSQTIQAQGGPQSSTFTTTAPLAQVPIEIHQSAAPDHLRNIQIVHHNHLGSYQFEPFHPLYLRLLQPFGTLRFMDWGKTNDNPLLTWLERTRPDHYTQTRPEGTAFEWMIALSNTLDQDAWICIPHQADDDFVRQLARLVRDSLDPPLRAWIEYSNETWNWQFAQSHYIQAQGVALGLDPDPFVAMHEYASLRSVQIWRIFEEEFGPASSSRLVKVLSGQSAWSTVAQLRIDGLLDPENNPDLVWPDALGIAPYFGFTFTTQHIPPTAPAYPTVDWIVDVLAPQQIEATRQGVIAHKAIANVQGLSLVCYEAGQHFVASIPANNNAVLVQILNDANRDPRMYDRYMEYLDMLEEEGVERTAHFNYCGSWSKWGSWGALEVQDQPLQQAPKYRALTDWILAH